MKLSAADPLGYQRRHSHQALNWRERRGCQLSLESRCPTYEEAFVEVACPRVRGLRRTRWVIARRERHRPRPSWVEDLKRASRRSDTLQVRARQADPIITCHYSRRQVSTQPLRRGALEASPTHQSSTASSRRAAVEDKTTQASQHAALALATTPPSSSLRPMRVTRLPALTGKSTSKLARSLRQRRVLEGYENGAARIGTSPVRTTTPPAATSTSHARECEGGAARVGLPPGTNDDAPPPLSQGRAVLGAKPTPSTLGHHPVRTTKPLPPLGLTSSIEHAFVVTHVNIRRCL